MDSSVPTSPTSQSSETPPQVSTASSAPPATTSDTTEVPSANPTPTSSANDTGNTPPKKSSKMVLILLAVLIALVIIVGIAYFLILQGGNKVPKTALAPTETPASTPTLTLSPNDTTDAGLDRDNTDATTALTNLDTQLSDVNAALNDQAPNLQ